MDTQRFVFCSSRGVQQVMAFDLLRTDRGFSVRSKLLIDGCLPKPGPCVLNPLSEENALKWINYHGARLGRSAAAFRPALSFAQQIEMLFFGAT